jgi:hypothetical protein
MSATVRPAAPAATSLLALVTRLLRDPQDLVDDVDVEGGASRYGPGLLATTAVGGALLGGVVGAHHGGVQVLYAALKTPALLLLPPIVALPAVHAAWDLLGAEVPWRRVSAAALVGMARTAVLAAALGPLVWLGTSVGLGYHDAVLVFAGALVLAGLPGLLTVLRALPRPQDLPRIAVLGSLLVLGASFAQTGWLLRPFVARPSAEVSFLRPLEEDAFSSLAASQRSARGDYRGWETRSAGFLARPDERAAPLPAARGVALERALEPHVEEAAAVAAEPAPVVRRPAAPVDESPVDPAGGER